MKNKIIEILKNDTFIIETENRDDYYIHNADEIAEIIVKLFAIPVVVLQSEQFSLSDIYKIAQNYTEEQFIEMVKHLQG